MILETEAEVEAYITGLWQASPFRTHGENGREAVRKMYRPHVGYDTDQAHRMPWMKSNGPTSNDPTSNIHPDAPHGFGIRQPIGEDPAPAAFDQPGRSHSRTQPENSRGDRRQPSNDQHSTKH